MLFLLDKNVRTVKWNGIPLHEASSAIVKEETNGDFYLTVRYPITDSGIYQLIKEDMLIKAPVPVLDAQLFRIKKPVENDDSLDITAYHISDDIMRRSIKPISVVQLGCATALSQMVQNAKTDLGDFSFTSDISDNRTFNTTETETLYSVLMDGKHSIVGTWEGELVRDNFALSIKRSRGADRGVIITTHKNLKSYQRTKNSQNVVTRIHARSTFKPEGAEDEVALKVTVDSPLINSYPYINEKEYENNNAKTIDDLRKWAEAKFKNDGIDKVSDAIKIEAYELDGQVVHLGDTVNLKSRKHSVDLYKKAIAYEFNALTEEYISITFDDKPGVGGSGMSSGLSNAADAILGASTTAQNVAIERALKNADAAFDAEFNKRSEAIKDDIEKIKAHAEAIKAAMTDQLNLKINQSKSEVTDRLQKEFNQKLSSASADLAAVRANLTQDQSRLSGDISQIQSDIADIRGKQSQADSELAKQVQSINQAKSELAGVKTNLTQAQSQLTSNIAQIRSDVGSIRTKQGQQETEISKQVAALNATKSELAGVKSAQATYEQTTTRRLAELSNLADGKASKSELTQTAEELKSRIASVQASGRNLFLNSLFKQDIRKAGILTTSTYTATVDDTNKYLGHNALKIVGQDPAGKDGGNPKITYPATGQYDKVVPGSMTNQEVTISFYAKAENVGTILRSRLGYIGFKDGNVTLTTEVKRYVVKLPKSWTGLSNVTTNEWLFNLNRADTVWIWMPKFEVSDTDTPYSEAPEDVENQISAVESTFKQRADSLEASVSSMREGLKTKADSSALTVLSDSIKQSVKSLETNTQNQLNQKLSTAEFDVRANRISQEIVNATRDKADKTLVTAEAGRLREELASLQVGGRNLLKGSKGPFKPNRNPANFDNNVLYHNETSVYMVNGQRYLISAKTDGIFTSHHDGLKESDNVVLWIMDKAVANYQIVSDAKTGTTGTEFVWNRPTGTYHLRVNTYRKDPEKLKSVWEVKVEQGSFKTDWSPAPEDTEGLITEAKASFERTAQGLRMDLTAVQAYVSADGTRLEALRTFSREETARQLTALRQSVEAGYVGKATYAEDVKGISRRFEELTVGGRNLALGTSKEWSAPFTSFSGNANVCPPLYKVLTDGLQVGDTLRSKIILKYTDVRPAAGKTATVWLQGNGNVTGWTAGAYNGSPAKTLNGSGEITFEHSFKITENHLKNAYWNWMFRTDFIASGSLQWKLAKVESGSVYTSWSPAPEDATSYADTKLAEFRQSIDGQLATVQAALNTANSSLMNFNSWKQSAQETLNKVGRVETGLNETKTSLAEIKQTAQGLRTDLSAIQSYVNADGTRLEALRTFSREETARQLTALRQSVEAGYVGKATYAEDVKGISRRFEELTVGGRNLALGTSKEWSAPFTSFSGNANVCPPLYKVLTDGLQVGDTLRSKIILKYTDVRPAAGKTATVWLQGNGNVTGWTAGAYNGSPAKTLNGSGEITFEHSFKITENHLKNAYWNWMFRTDFIASGSLQWKLAKVESGSVYTSWSPAPEDATSYADTKLAEFRQGIDGQLATVQAAINTANSSLTSFNTWKQSAQETLNKVGKVETGLNETKTSLAEFKQTAQGLRTDLSAIQSYVNADGTRAEALRTYSREETARQLTAERKLIEAGYVAKATHTEDVRSISRRFEELKTSSETKLAEFRQGIDGQFATMSSQIGESLKKTDISITPGQIVLGTGKVVNGQTLASLFVQNPESMQAITKLMRITGDLIVDGSITGRDLAAGAITTPHLAAGAVTAEVLGANAVTADKVKADDALLEKLSAGEALLKKLMAKDAFVNRLQSIDFTANQIRGGVLGSIDGTLNFDLNKNTLIMGSNTAAIKRVSPGHPTQFMRYETERKGNVDYTRTIIGSNRNGSEKFDSVTFAGLVVENSNKAGIEDSLRLYGDNTYFRHAQGEVGWNINAVTQRMAPATWQKESAIWSRSFVVPKHRNPNGRDWVKLEETVAALWRLWEHAAGNQVTMTGAMRDKVRELFQNYGYNYGIS
ncbi:phage tail spike protein [Streptococcus cristatus]|uniref:phage tail spike protein n=1 Tax=Streptococcus cristatus TaxID=45634 RepID=UPI0039C4DCC1